MSFGSSFAELAAAAVGAGERLPCALVDLDAFDRNAARVRELAAGGGKRVRVATKSIRCPELVRRAAELLGGEFGGLMTYSAAETAFWAGEGMKDLLLAYPTLSARDAEALAKAGASVVIDDPAQLGPLAAAARVAGATIGVVVELDLAWRPGGAHIGARRSPLRDAETACALAARAAATDGLRFDGVMGYESQIAGLPDRSPVRAFLNPAKRAIKRLSRPQVERARAELVAALRARGLLPRLVNGGGTGNLPWCAAEATLTEVTAGSAFLPGHLFDGFRDVSFAPSLVFALQVVRRPAAGYVTCHGGGFVASGEAGVDRLPRPVWPAGLSLLGAEGAGEVQTPLRVPDGVELALGGVVLFRHAKSGEPAEHFNEYLLVRGGRVESRAPTYRGLGHCFL